MDDKTNRTPNRPAATVTPIRGGIAAPGGGTETGRLDMADFLTLVVFSLLDQHGDDGEDGE